MYKPTHFITQQHLRLNYLNKEKEIVEKGNKRSDGKPVLAIHDMRIEQMERFLGL